MSPSTPLPPPRSLLLPPSPYILHYVVLLQAPSSPLLVLLLQPVHGLHFLVPQEGSHVAEGTAHTLRAAALSRTLGRFGAYAEVCVGGGGQRGEPCGS